MRSFSRFPLTALAVALLAATAGCSDDASDDSGSDSDAGTDSGSPEPAGASAEVVGELEGGNGVFLAAGMPAELPTGWTEAEFAVEGTAVSYAADGALPTDGMYDLHEGGTAGYRTRIVVRRPPAADFNGTVVVEWLNVSGGLDTNPDWAFLTEELTRSGYAWVGVSAQHIGVEGGPVLVTLPLSEGNGAGMGLKALDPERYGELNHPGDAYAYDIFTQVARLLRTGGSDGVLGDLEPARILAVGESQSAFMLTTYYNGVQPLTLAFDGFFVHSRGGGGAPLGMPGKGIDLLSAINAPDVTLRTDLDVPAFVLETETDMLFILNYFPARQPNSGAVHSWEVAGTAHADEHLLGSVADQAGCSVALNSGPLHFVAKAALHHLDAWVRSGEAPPKAAVLEIDTAATPDGFVLDANGNATGGVRTPQLDVPVDTLSGAPGSGSVACMLFGSTTPLSAERLAELYDSPAAYLDAYTVAADAAIEAGFVLEADRQALLDDADPTRIAP